MSIVQASRKTLKAKIDPLLEMLKKKTIAEGGFDVPVPVLAAAMTKVDGLAKTITRPISESATSPPSRRPGAFEVTLPDSTKASDKGISWHEIIFNVTGELIPVPPEQLKLKADVDATLTTLYAIFPDYEAEEKTKHPTPNQRRFAAYQTKLLGVAQTGLQTPADPEASQKCGASSASKSQGATCS